MTALLKSLPKALRRNFMPVSDYVQALLEVMKPNDQIHDRNDDRMLATDDRSSDFRRQLESQNRADASADALSNCGGGWDGAGGRARLSGASDAVAQRGAGQFRRITDP